MAGLEGKDKVVDDKDESGKSTDGVPGKDKVVDDKDESGKSTDGVPAGAILENGKINWDCPCMGGFQNGPCGQSFRDSFSCFIQSKTEPKGSDCYEQMGEWTKCMQENEEYYNKLKENSTKNDADSDQGDDDDNDEDDDDDDSVR